MTKKDFWTTIGFLAFMLGMTSLTLSVVGIQFSFLAFLDTNRLVGFIAKILMVIFGLIAVILAQTNWKES